VILPVMEWIREHAVVRLASVAAAVVQEMTSQEQEAGSSVGPAVDRSRQVCSSFARHGRCRDKSCPFRHAMYSAELDTR
jgi:hypothetical protein